MEEKFITVEELEKNFDEVLDDCHNNNVKYTILIGGEPKFLMLPAEEYDELMKFKESIS